MNPQVDLYLADGCGRCSLYQSPECKVHSYGSVLAQLRKLVLSCNLKEELKWSQPCYTYQNKNVLMITAFKDYACISFFKGSLLKDPYKLLHSPGENSQAVKQMRFTRLSDLEGLEEQIVSYIMEAIQLEKAGAKVDFKKDSLPYPPELQEQFTQDPLFEEKFKLLTPGRQRGYLLHFTQAKQATTRTARIEKYKEKIFEGKGFHD